MRLRACIAATTMFAVFIAGCSRAKDSELAKARAEAEQARAELAKVKSPPSRPDDLPPQQTQPSATPPITPPSSIPVSEPSVLTDTQRLLADYARDNRQADSVYKDKWIQISGTVVGRPAPDTSDNVYVMLDRGSQQKYYVTVYFKDRQQKAVAALWTEGRQVTVRGRCGGLSRPIFFGRDEDASLVPVWDCQVVK